MTNEGYADYEIANLISYRFLAVVLFALPFGIFIKGKRLIPYYRFVTIGLPTVSLIVIELVSLHIYPLISAALVVWGILFSTVFITTLPFIIRNAPKEHHTSSISLSTATWSTATVITGIGVYILMQFLPQYFSEKQVLQFFALVGYLSCFFVFSMDTNENLGEDPPEGIGIKPKLPTFDYDWALIFIAAIPVLLIAIGAGLTIPFMNLFFFHVFDLSTQKFSLLGSVTSVVVAGAALLVPVIKKRYGYESVTVTQMLAVVALVLLGSSDFLSHWRIAFYFAIICYIIRQPLMNLANPMTSEMTMYYVGKKNQEIISAITSSIWSGSWFISSQIFRWLRTLDLRYGYIFYITAALYVVGIFCYFLLIKDFRKKEKLGLIET